MCCLLGLVLSAGGGTIVGGSVYARSFFRKRKAKAVMDKHLAAVAEFEADYLHTREYMLQVAEGTCADHGITQVRKMRKMMEERTGSVIAWYDLQIPAAVNKHLGLADKYPSYLATSSMIDQTDLRFSVLNRQLRSVEMQDNDWTLGGYPVKQAYEWLDAVMREVSDYYDGVSHDIRKQWEVELRVAAREIALLCLIWLPDPDVGLNVRVARAQSSQQVEAATTKIFTMKKKLRKAAKDATPVKVANEKEFLARVQATMAGVDSMSPLSNEEQRLVRLYKGTVAGLAAEKQHQGDMFVEQLEGAAAAAKNAASFSATTRPQAEALAAENREYALEGLVRIVEANANEAELAQLKHLQVANRFLSNQLKK